MSDKIRNIAWRLAFDYGQEAMIPRELIGQQVAMDLGTIMHSVVDK